MKYFVRNQYGNLSIQDWDQDMSSNPSFESLAAEQIAYLEQYPDATAQEVRALSPRPTPPVLSTPSLEETKERAIRDVSAHSLKTIGRFVSTYQYANADASLKVPDGDGIYTHAVAQQYIDTYLRLGKACREKYYQTEAAIETAETVEEVDLIKNNSYDWYNNIEKL